MKKVIILLFVVSLVATASIVLQTINHSEIVITNYDGYYNSQWQEKIKNSSDVSYLKAEALKLKAENRGRRNDKNSLMLNICLKTSVLFLILFATMLCFLFYKKK